MARFSNIRWLIPLVATLGLAWGFTGRAQDPGTGRKVGDKLDSAVQDIRSGLRKAGSSAKDAFENAKTSVNNMSVESRVYGRLHWDKALNDATIELTVSQEGVITLDGAVANAKAKSRALMLAEETVGVTRVIDRLGVRPPTISTP